MNTIDAAQPAPPGPGSDHGSTPLTEDRLVYPVVGIGASAGGLEAVQQLLAHLPDKPGMAFVLIQHLDPKHESRLTDLLSKSTRMPVLEAIHGLAARPDHLYVIPPNTSMTIAQGILQLEPRGEGRTPHLPVDLFLRSLATDAEARAIAVILSGTGSDGTFGVAEIKAVGVTTFAQDEKTARHHQARFARHLDKPITPEDLNVVLTSRYSPK